MSIPGRSINQRGAKVAAWAALGATILCAVLCVAVILGAVYLFFHPEWHDWSKRVAAMHENADPVGFLGLVCTPLCAALASLSVAGNNLRRKLLETSASAAQRLAEIAEEIASAVQAREKLALGQLLGYFGEPASASIPLVEWKSHTPAEGVSGKSMPSESIGQYFLDAPTPGASHGDVWSRRLLIVGAPGAGKTVLALKLLQQLHEHRTSSQTDERILPVPVRFTLPSWRGEYTLDGFKSWVADELCTTFAGLKQSQARDLVNEGLIFPVLDGLDEMDAPGEHSRAAAALAALSEATLASGDPLGMVITSRLQEFKDLSEQGNSLDDALRVVMQPISAQAVIQFICKLGSKRQESLMAPEWLSLLTDRTSGPHLLELFANPWHLALGEAYFGAVGAPGFPERQRHVDALRLSPDDGSPGEDDTSAAYQKRVLQLLLDEFVSARLKLAGRAFGQANTHESMTKTKRKNLRAAAAYPEKSVDSWLRGTARLLQGDVNLVPWVWGRAWAGSRKRSWDGSGTLVKQVAGVVTSAPMLVIVVSVALLARVTGIGGILIFSSIVAMAGCVGYFTAICRPIVRKLAWPTRSNLITFLVVALASGVSVGVSVWQMAGLAVSLAVSLAVGLTVGLTFGHIPGSTEIPVQQQCPRETLHTELSAVLEIGLAVGLSFGLAFGLSGSLRVGLAFGLAFGATVGLTLGLIGSASASYWATALVGWWRHGLPLRYVRFAEAMREAGIFRVAGSAYQFRHRELQAHLDPNNVKETTVVDVRGATTSADTGD